MNETDKTPTVVSLGDACCGCGACAARCPKFCIVMEADAWGFLHPVVDATACVGCGACGETCPVLNVPDESGCSSVLWVKARDTELLDCSSSGGVFGLLARDTLSHGGVVAGAEWADGCHRLRHVIVNNRYDLDSVMRSKYVQSTVGREVYEGIRDALREGRPALYAGTACQVAGMRLYLGELANSGLFLGVDVICHGVPSPELWRRWLGFVGTRERGEIYGVNFRSKRTGWSSYSVMYEYVVEGSGAPGVASSPFANDWYMRAFLENASLRPSCLTCPFKRKCGSDVTLGDYWGIHGQHPEVDIKGGVSAVIASTARGAEAVARISGSVDSGASSLEGVAAGNSSLVRPARPFVDRDAFMGALAEGASIADMMARWDFEPTLKQRIVSRAKGAAKRLLGRA